MKFNNLMTELDLTELSKFLIYMENTAMYEAEDDNKSSVGNSG